MAQNIIVKNKDNPVVINFTGVDLTQATEIEVLLDQDSWTLTGDPTRVIVNSATQLQLELGNTTSSGMEYLTITIFDSGNPNGYEATSGCIGNLEKAKIVE